MARGWIAAGLLAGIAMPADAQTEQLRFPTYPGTAETATWTVDVAAAASGDARRFTLRSSAPQRDDTPSTRVVDARAGDPAVRSGSPMFDALFAMTVAEAHADSVDAIRDDSYNNGDPIACHCFETGEKWHYVWTRDLSYALDLGLAGFDPSRAAESLLFKTSGLRPGAAAPVGLPASTVQIVQDTGSGGSWPVSTDRTTWALGAERTLANLSGAGRAAFAAKALAALTGTLEADRIAAFDPHDGLYGGEHSFLDWREQTYAPWIVDDLSWMARSKALSTNIVQLRAMRLAARLAHEAGDAARATRYAGWATTLATTIDRAFWNEKAGMYVTFLTADRTAAQVAKYDLLGNALAIEAGIADRQRSRRILSSYPFAPYGPPVVWPQAPDMFVYHNRAQWPFVTAYALRAAVAAGHVAAVDRAIGALVRGTAINLSNMENFEWLSSRGRFDDGPEINSRRQLWSVGGYYGAVVGTIFGWQPDMDGVAVRPFLTTATRRMLGSGDTASLKGIHYHGKPVEITLRLPPVAADGAYHPVASVVLNGRAVTGRIFDRDLAAQGNRIEIRFGTPATDGATVTQVPQIPATSHDDARAFMAKTPTIATVQRANRTVTVKLAGDIPATQRFALYRDGTLIGFDLAGSALIDKAPPVPALSACYTVVLLGQHASHPSAAVCAPGSAAQTITATDPKIVTTAERMPAEGGVGAPTIRLAAGKTLMVPIDVARDGMYVVTIRYDNHVHQLNTGITNAVKRIMVTHGDARDPASASVVQMPHVRPDGDRHPLRLSTPVYVRMRAGRNVLELSDFLNMSSLASNTTYSGPGGAEETNEARISAILIDRVD
jgi:hypothetical protein